MGSRADLRRRPLFELALFELALFELALFELALFELALRESVWRIIGGWPELLNAGRDGQEAVPVRGRGPAVASVRIQSQLYTRSVGRLGRRRQLVEQMAGRLEPEAAPTGSSVSTARPAVARSASLAWASHLVTVAIDEPARRGSRRIQELSSWFFKW